MLGKFKRSSADADETSTAISDHAACIMHALVACHAGAGMHAPRLEGAYRSGDTLHPPAVSQLTDHGQARDA